MYIYTAAFSLAALLAALLTACKNRCGVLYPAERKVAGCMAEAGHRPKQ